VPCLDTKKSLFPKGPGLPQSGGFEAILAFLLGGSNWPLPAFEGQGSPEPAKGPVVADLSRTADGSSRPLAVIASSN